MKKFEKAELKRSEEDNSKYYKPCIGMIDGKKCLGKWFHYKAK
jgi:hypothetical protein